MSLLNTVKNLFTNEDTHKESNNLQPVKPVKPLDSNKINKKSLTNEELEEKSWDFLYDITNKVEHSFSEDDCQKISSVGKNMDKVGILYYHIVNKSQK